MPLDDLPDRLPDWCLDQLGGEPAEVLFQVRQVSMVFGLRPAGPGACAPGAITPARRPAP
jgi:hypothetical protein